MPLAFRGLPSGIRIAEIPTMIRAIEVYVPGGEAGPTSDALALAEEIAASIDTFAERARGYLDLFVDREKACGNPQEPWWLDEIELGYDAGSGRPAAALVFTLHGDGDGFWKVVFRRAGPEIRPYRFERLQG